jgi:hypothetical protein
MFLRWKRRKLRPRYDRGVLQAEHSWYAVLVRSERVDGKPRQRVVRYLGHILEKHLGATAHREGFWKRMDWHLDDLNLDPATRGQVETKLGALVKRPTSEELDALTERRRASESRPLT